MRKIFFVMWFLGLLHLIVFSGVEATETQTIKKHDFKWAISADTVLNQLRQKEKPIVIDVRSSDLFDKARIPGSVNMPLYAVKTKPFLKEQRAVIVDEGYLYGRIESECRKLNGMGFHVSILFGGLNAWMKAGGKMVGSLFIMEDMKKVSPQAFHLEKDYENHLLIDISTKNSLTGSALTPNTIHLPVIDEGFLRSSILCKTSDCKKKTTNKFNTIVIANEDGSGYGKVEKITKEMKIKNVFYLDGGFRAYRKYLERLSLSRQPKESRIKHQKKCGDCGA